MDEAKRLQSVSECRIDVMHRAVLLVRSLSPCNSRMTAPSTDIVLELRRVKTWEQEMIPKNAIQKSMR